MITLVDGLPDHIVGVTATGRVTQEDYQEVLIPAVERALGRHDKVRLYYELGPAFAGIDPGAMLEDFRIGVAHLPRWERIAVVTDVEWIRHAVSALGFLLPSHTRVFATTGASDARAWIAAA